MQNKTVKILFFGDIIGTPGCQLFGRHAQSLKASYKADAVIVNVENSAPNGRGTTSKILSQLKEAGADFFTSGNHIWDQKELLATFNDQHQLIRPANFPSVCPGKGVGFIEVQGVKVALVNIQGRVFMRQHLDCPFKTLDSLVTFVKAQTSVVIVDFHAEASSEKIGLAYYADGKVSAVIGTHTHIQTADARILPNGTAMITDVGCSGSLNSMIGMTKESVLHNLITQMPSKFEVDTKPPFVICALFLEIDAVTGKALSIQPIRLVENE